MAKPFVYTGPEPVALIAGLDGLGETFETGRDIGFVRVPSTTLGVYALYVVPNQDTYSDQTAKVGARFHNGTPSTKLCTLHNKPIVEFVSFGRSHRYHAEDYGLYSSRWRDNLLGEARILANSILADQTIARNYHEADGSLGAFGVHVVQGALDKLKSLVKSCDIPTVEDYEPLSAEVWKVSQRIKDSTPDDYYILHEAGLTFQKIRFEQKNLNERLRKRLENLIDIGGYVEEALRQTESLAFWVLDLAAQVKAGGNPGAEAAYRCGVMMVRASATGVGYAYAEYSNQQSIRAAGEIVRKDFPGIATDLIMHSLHKAMPSSGSPAMKAFAEELIGIQVWTLFFTVDWMIFEKEKLPPADRARASEILLDKLAVGLADQAIGAILRIVIAHKTAGMSEDDAKRIWLDRIATVVPALVSAVITEIVSMVDRAAVEHRDFYQVFCSEIGFALVRIIKEVGKAFIKAPLQRWMTRKQQSDQEYNAEIRKCFRELISVVRSEFASKPALPGPAKPGVPSMGQPNSGTQPGTTVLPSTKLIQNSAGVVHTEEMTGLAKTPRVTAPPAPTKPAGVMKLPKSARIRVNLLGKVPNNDSRQGKEFAGTESKQEWRSNAEEVLRQYEDDLHPTIGSLKTNGGSRLEVEAARHAALEQQPFYRCSNMECKFIHNYKSLFQLDHTVAIKDGGGLIRLTPKQVEAARRDPGEFYKQGYQPAVLCAGCNQGKNRKVGQAPGIIPPRVGYAYTRHEEDMNPDNNYHGNPVGDAYQDSVPVTLHSRTGVPVK